MMFLNMRHTQELQETIPNARPIWIKDGGHWLMKKKKPEEISGHRIAFLNGK